ncbi:MULTISPECIES: virulence factor family protein [Alphaproteobacteria]|uniref:Virulence factor family protein n=2 Tax=Alphaproteobacteria TaxID=28211 RepID=A0A512HLP4_9HYPH|nr:MULTISPECIES: AcvB/VirJ family lysyl-phosphatidylglycerol hydrolase [Alphaproteobacteria]GEO86361.1 virulence factor family protein [Ciceribacter naphthalenivorans]GLR21843.1 virulence factor family protein [Ciceribacter naphthalenivorans]GLT04699.1 virulence factor family protein [Sphingomonas psychrolutea]
MIHMTAILALATTLGSAALAEDAELDSGMIPSPVILLPDDTPQAIVVLLSDKDGWQGPDQKEAERLKANGAIVMGIDTPKYIDALSRDTGDCIYTVSDIEEMSHQLQRKAQSTTVLQPIIAGRGEGAALALAILAQTPKATIGQTLALDPEAGIPLLKPFCTPATKIITGDRTVYALTDGDLPDPATVLLTPAASADGREHVASLASAHSEIDIRELPDNGATAFSGAIDELVAAESSSDMPLGLPLSILDTEPAHDTMAIVYSGDGGWRDLDREVAGYLQKDGIPVVGLDSLRYFWSERTPAETAADLEKIIKAYEKRWNVRHVLLVGYSFGADVLPAAYRSLPDKVKSRVAQISLMALSHQVDYEISVAGWLGATDGNSAGDPLNDIGKIDPSLVQCFYGEDEEDDACRDLKAGKVEAIELSGGHHFDGDYQALTQRIVDGLTKRLAN